ncbi:hypothetical protein [Paraburkholderia strydomiana]
MVAVGLALMRRARVHVYIGHNALLAIAADRPKFPVVLSVEGDDARFETARIEVVIEDVMSDVPAAVNLGPKQKSTAFATAASALAQVAQKLLPDARRALETVVRRQQVAHSPGN